MAAMWLSRSMAVRTAVVPQLSRRIGGDKTMYSREQAVWIVKMKPAMEHPGLDGKPLIELWEELSVAGGRPLRDLSGGKVLLEPQVARIQGAETG
jgi:hypothetical protein